jgi:hypothetical protein
MARFKAGVVPAAGAAVLRKLSTADSQSLDVSAEAIAGIEATAAPKPSPMASNPSRVKARVHFIDLPFPQQRNCVFIAVSAQPRCVGPSLCAAVNFVRTKSNNSRKSLKLLFGSRAIIAGISCVACQVCFAGFTY